MKELREESKNLIISRLKEAEKVVVVPYGNSMWPFIPDRSASVLIEKNFTILEVYDVVLFINKRGRLVLHRIIDQIGDEYVLSGDSQLYTENIKKDQILGKLTEIYTENGVVNPYKKKTLDKVKKWYKHKILRKLKIKNFYFWLRVKNKLRRK